MKKQEFMDKQSKTKEEIKILTLMLAMSKTQLLTALRHLKMMHKALYTTEMRQTDLETLLQITETAHTFMEEGEITEYGQLGTEKPKK